MTWAFESLTNFHLNGLLLRKVYIVWAEKSTEELSFITFKNDAKFEEKLACGLENEIRNLVNFHESTQKCQNWDSKVQMYELKLYWGVSCHDSEE